MQWMSQRKQRETKQQPNMLPGPAVPGCCLVSFYFLCYILCSHSLGTWDTSKCSKILRLKDILQTMMSNITEGEKIRRKICGCGTTRISVSSFSSLPFFSARLMIRFGRPLLPRSHNGRRMLESWAS